MRTNRMLLWTAAAVLLFSSPAAAALIELGAELDPSQEVPPHNTPGYGSADATLDTGTGLFTISGTGSYADLLGGATRVSLVDGAPGMNGMTIGLLTLDTPGNTSGTFEGSVAGLTSAQITDAQAGNTYLNIADSVYPSGEVRGELLVTTPEPSSIVLTGLAAIGLAVVARRRRKSA
jgi:CHRD domain/PEP-CTERM motif